MKELEKVRKEIKAVLIEGEQNNEAFHWLVDKLGMIRMYEQGLPIHMVLGIIDEWMEDVEERNRVKALEGFDESHIQMPTQMPKQNGTHETTRMDINSVPMVRVHWVDARDTETGWLDIKDIIKAPLANCMA